MAPAFGTPGTAQALALTADPKEVSTLLRHSGDPAAARAVAQQFGALLMQNLMQQTDGSGMPMVDGVGGGVVNSLFASTMGRAAMAGEKMGLTDLLLRSIQQKQMQAGGAAGAMPSPLGLPPSGRGGMAAAPHAVPAAPGAGLPLTPYWQSGGLRPLAVAAHLPAAALAIGTVAGPPPYRSNLAVPAPAVAEAVPPPASASAPSTGGGATSADIAAFGARLSPLLQEAGRQLGVSPRILLAQAAIETGWGRSIVGNNLFGIKAGASWPGPQVSASTHEYENGQLVAIRDNFRAYPDFAASVRDFVSLVSGSRRYQAALGSGDDAGAYARALLAGGWATDIDYVRKLEAVAAGRNVAAAFAPIPLIPAPLTPAAAPSPVAARAATTPL